MTGRRPYWLDKKIDFRSMHGTERRLAGLDLQTVCHQARCPNIGECFGRGTATFLILGGICTRRCGFCAVTKGTPLPPDRDEPRGVAEAAARLGLRHLVITSVTRDDLSDGGANHFAATVAEAKRANPGMTVEVLTPDFLGNEHAVETVAAAGPDIYGHNIETVPSLYPERPSCDYRRGLSILAAAKRAAPGARTKSAILLGMGETDGEVEGVMHDLRVAGCDYLAIGQYLRPGRGQWPVRRYVTPERFDVWGVMARAMGFLHVESGPYVRSSYHADRYA